MLKNILFTAAAALLMATQATAVAGKLIYTPCKTRSNHQVPNDADLSDILDSADFQGLDAGKSFPGNLMNLFNYQSLKKRPNSKNAKESTVERERIRLTCNALN